jgi:hypothetical protein
LWKVPRDRENEGKVDLRFARVEEQAIALPANLEYKYYFHKEVPFKNGII